MAVSAYARRGFGSLGGGGVNERQKGVSPPTPVKAAANASETARSVVDLNIPAGSMDTHLQRV